ncbi:MAG: hemolysin family protein [Eubacteriales bacterium]|nr:hemolysin family protein [Eubacteriales bacterium]
MDIFQQLLLQVVLILVNAFFAASEIAVISLNEGKLERQAKDGDKKAQHMLKMVTQPEEFLSTIQIGITLAGFLASAFAAEDFSGRLAGWLINTVGLTAIPVKTIETISIILITIILSFFMLLFGELVPKRIAMKKSEQLARAVSGIIRFFSIILHPMVWFMSAATNGVLRLIGINPDEKTESVSEDEIRLMIDIGEEKGTIESTEREMIDNIFEFNNSSAADIMIHRTGMVVIWEDDTEEDIIKAIHESGFSRFPVCSEDIDNIIGILRVREYLLNRQKENPEPLRDILAPVYFVPETVRADVLFRDMQEKKIHLAVVVDEYGGTSGMITMEDLLEEIVGNIYDESDTGSEPEITELAENEWRISGAASLEEIEDALDIEFDEDEDDFGTLGGLIFSCLTQIPENGTQPEVETHGLKIRVENITDHRVIWARVTKLAVPETVAAEAE